MLEAWCSDSQSGFIAARLSETVISQVDSPGAKGSGGAKYCAIAGPEHSSGKAGYNKLGSVKLGDSELLFIILVAVGVGQEGRN